jgi:long-chain fatty acid transport protein
MMSFNKSERMVDQSMFGYQDGKMQLDCDGGGWGYNLGALFFLTEQISLGFQYRSNIEIDHSGDATLENIAPELRPLFGGQSYTTDISTTIDFPEIYSFAIAYRPNEKLILALDAELVRWSSFDTMEIDFKTEIPEAGLTDISAVLDWKDIWVIKVGGEYKLNEKIALRAGYAYGKNPVPDKSLEPSNPDSDQHNFSVGAGYKFDKWIIDIFYDAAFYEERNVTNNILSGEYENFTHFTGFSVGYSF